MNLELFKNANKIEVGCDEVGRGCLLGRVYAASVIMPNSFDDNTYLQIRDSKRLSAKKRAFLANYIKDISLDWSIGYIDEKTIDKINILQSSVKAMHNSLDGLNISPDTILVDGDYFKEYLDKDDNFISYECIPNGDSTHLSIAAASILAKVERDNYICQLVKNNPYLNQYDLLKNKGYGTQKHIEGLRKYGISPFHRRTFGICKELSRKISN